MGYARSVIRAVAYRRDFTTEPDEALVAAAERLGDDDLLGLIALNEAAVQWRGTPHDVPLASVAKAAFDRMHRTDTALLASAMLLGWPISDELIRSIPNRYPRVRVQALGLLRCRSSAAQALWLAERGDLCQFIPSHHTSKRMEVVSIEEILR